MNGRVLISLVALVAAIAVGLGVAALVAWPSAEVSSDGDALARVTLPRLGGSVAAVEVHTAAGTTVPVMVRGGCVWPVGRLAAGEQLRVALTVRRPGYAGWLVGKTETRRFTITTPTAHLRGRRLQVAAGAPVRVAFDQPVSLVWLGPGQPVQRLAHPQAVFPVGKVAAGSHAVGSVEVRRRRARGSGSPPRCARPALRVRLRREPGHAHLGGRRPHERAAAATSTEPTACDPAAALPTGEDRLRMGEALHRLPGAEPDEATGWSNATLTGAPAATSATGRAVRVGVVIVKRRVSVLPTSQPAFPGRLTVSANRSRSPAASLPTGHTRPPRTMTGTVVPAAVCTSTAATLPPSRGSVTRASASPSEETSALGHATSAATPSPTAIAATSATSEIKTRPFTPSRPPSPVACPRPLLASGQAPLPGRPLP